MQIIEKEKIVTYVGFDCGNTFYTEAHTKVGQINRDRKIFPGSCEKHKCIPSDDQLNCTNDEEHTSNIFLNLYSLWDVDPAAVMSLCHSITLLIGTPCPIRILKQQLTTLEQTYIRCVLQCARWTVKGEDFSSALHFFRVITHQTGK